jgi:hypothetical protein
MTAYETAIKRWGEAGIILGRRPLTREQMQARRERREAAKQMRAYSRALLKGTPTK